VQNSKLTPANIVILAGGAVILIGSFLPFYKFSLPDLGLGIGGGDQTFSAWSSDAFLFGVATLVVLIGVIMALQVALTAFANVRLPDRVLGMTWDQIHVALGFQATVMMIAFLVRDKGVFDFGIGFFLMLVAAIALLVGAIMRQRESAPTF
jgi:hypothetical protein